MVADCHAEKVADDNSHIVKDETTEVVEVEDSVCDSDSSDSASEFCAPSDEGGADETSMEPPTKVARAGRVEQANFERLFQEAPCLQGGSLHRGWQWLIA